MSSLALFECRCCGRAVLSDQSQSLCSECRGVIDRLVLKSMEDGEAISVESATQILMEYLEQVREELTPTDERLDRILRERDADT